MRQKIIYKALSFLPIFLISLLTFNIHLTKASTYYPYCSSYQLVETGIYTVYRLDSTNFSNNDDYINFISYIFSQTYAESDLFPLHYGVGFALRNPYTCQYSKFNIKNFSYTNKYKNIYELTCFCGNAFSMRPDLISYINNFTSNKLLMDVPPSSTTSSTTILLSTTSTTTKPIVTTTTIKPTTTTTTQLPIATTSTTTTTTTTIPPATTVPKPLPYCQPSSQYRVPPISFSISPNAPPLGLHSVFSPAVYYPVYDSYSYPKTCQTNHFREIQFKDNFSLIEKNPNDPFWGYVVHYGDLSPARHFYENQTNCWQVRSVYDGGYSSWSEKLCHTYNPPSSSVVSTTTTSTVSPPVFSNNTLQSKIVFKTKTKRVLKSKYRVGATCRDGTSSSATGKGACSHHGGVSFWNYFYQYSYKRYNQKYRCWLNTQTNKYNLNCKKV